MIQHITKAAKMALRLPSVAIIGLVSLYQIFISPVKNSLLGPYAACRFHPTCSSYACECFRSHGFWVGGYYTFRRILRCNPFHPGGFDPPPAAARSGKTNLKSDEASFIQKGKLTHG